MGVGTLDNDNWLYVGMSIFSKDRTVELRMQDDGKLAIYYNNRCQWQTTDQQDWNAKGAIMQGDGNFCIYDKNGKCTWHTNTAAPTGDSGTWVAVQDDGNLVLYKGNGHQPIWASHSNKP
ncbi:Mannose-specific lectin [Fusarium austroafricanum]|uniref:Mannose-specific lectin n=1 Tax=Fusarium austroafricanum TaxID=2364996 RepID=A0A8H4K6S9_9HYPO|nr:Mannose-specific lectin [Fusarium austroafricanum]